MNNIMFGESIKTFAALWVSVLVHCVNIVPYKKKNNNKLLCIKITCNEIRLFIALSNKNDKI